MKDVGIYLITNTVNGRRYVGSATSFKKRWRLHEVQLQEGRHHSRYLQRAWNKYGAGAFTFRPIIYCAKPDLIMYEQAAMDALKPEYNIVPTAGSMLGYRHTDETRAKLRAARARNPSSPRKGMKNSEESKRKVSLAKTGVKFGPYSEERKAKTAKAMRAWKSQIGEDDVRTIREMRASKMTAQAVSKQLGISIHIINDISIGKTWGWVK